MADPYGFEVYTRSGTFLADLSTLVYNPKLHAERNGADQVTFDINATELRKFAESEKTTAANLLGVGINELRVRRNSTYRVGGRIDLCEQDFADDKVLHITANGFLSIFSSLFVEVASLPYVATEANQILWDVINKIQTGDTAFWANSPLPSPPSARVAYGITRGHRDTIGNKNRTYEMGKSAYDILVQMTQLNTTPVDINFTPDKQFEVWSRLGTDHPELVFAYPHNLVNFKAPYDATSLVNRVLTLGQGTGAAAVIQSLVEDTPSEITYLVRQYLQQFSAISEVDTLDDHGMGRLNATKAPLLIPDCTIDTGYGNPTIEDFWIGDRVTFDISDQDMPYPVQGLFKFETIDVTIDENGAETVSAKLS